MARSPEKSELSDEQLDAWRAFLRAQSALIRTLDRELQEDQGLPITFFDVLAQLTAAGGRLRMSELADAVLLSRSGVTRLVDRMERDGLVKREHCPTGGRCTPRSPRQGSERWPSPGPSTCVVSRSTSPVISPRRRRRLLPPLSAA